MIFGISVILVVISSSFLFIWFLSLSLVSLANDLLLFYLLKKLALGFIDLFSFLKISILLVSSLIFFFFNSFGVLYFFLLNFYFYFILLYNTVLVLPYIDMNPPRDRMYILSDLYQFLPCVDFGLCSSKYLRWVVQVVSVTGFQCFTRVVGKND